MASTDALVTVGMCVYNGEEHVAGALLSVLGQTHENLEIIVYDDGSTDDTVAKVRSLADERVKILASGENRGIAFAREKVRLQASGDCLTWVDHDDVYMPDRVRSLLARASLTGADIVSDAYQVMTHEGELLDQFIRVSEKVSCEPHFTRLFERNCMNPHPLISRECYARVAFDTDMRVSEDYDYWLRCSWEGFTFALADCVGLHYRRTHNQLSGNHRAAREYTAAILAKYPVRGIVDLYSARGFPEGIINYMCCLQHIYRGEYDAALVFALRPWAGEQDVDQDFYRGTLLLRVGVLTDARAHLEAHLARHPGSPAGHNNMGVLLRRSGSAAVGWFERAHDLLPGYLDAAENLSGGEAVTDVQI